LKKTILTVALVAISSATFAQTDKEIASELFEQLKQRSFMEAPQNLYIGGPPHGAIRAVVEGEIDGNNTIVKFNYGGPNISAKEVAKDPDKWLKAITVMKRIPGYNPENKDWFFAKYKPNGDQLKVGKVEGCIKCHQSASGNDYVFKHNKSVNAEVTVINESWFNKFFIPW
jgi:hypothetical protein